jgi:hypothetical protein
MLLLLLKAIGVRMYLELALPESPLLLVQGLNDTTLEAPELLDRELFWTCGFFSGLATEPGVPTVELLSWWSALPEVGYDDDIGPPVVVVDWG